MRAILAVALAAAFSAAQAQIEKRDVHIAVGGKVALYYLPLTITERLGYFKDEGLNVRISDFAGGTRSLEAVVGGSADDSIGSAGMLALSNGNYIVASDLWDNSATPNAGAITLGLAAGGATGTPNTQHSVLGGATGDASDASFAYDAARNQLIVGQVQSNRVVLHRPGQATNTSIVGDTPDPSVGDQLVRFTATVSASPSAPTDGKVTMRASSGESCVDSTPTASSASPTACRAHACATVRATRRSGRRSSRHKGRVRAAPIRQIRDRSRPVRTASRCAHCSRACCRPPNRGCDVAARGRPPQ